MRLTLSLALAVAVLLALASLAVYGEHAAWLTLATFVPIGTAAVLAAHALVAQRGRLGGLRRQGLAAVGLLTAIVAAAVGTFVLVMFLSPHDAFFVVLLAIGTSLLAVLCGWLLARGALDDLDAVRATLRAVGDGERDRRTTVVGGGELRELGRAVDAMAERLAGEERARRDLVGAVSHDLRTPITALKLLTDAIGDGIVDEATARDYAGRMGVHLRALSGLIDDLFELSRLEAGDLRWSMQQVAIDDLLRETVEAMRPQAEASEVAVRAVLAAGDPLAVRGDPDRLQRVLFNLIQNAIRHTPADGTVTVRAARQSGGLEIEVLDTGEGVAEADRERVFEPLYRGDPSRTDGGAGLGLAIARAIVEAHGGRIWFADSDAGASVRLLLQPA